MATVVAVHAHPDDEVLLTGGTLARLADEGHRTVIAVATDGHVWAFDGPVAPRLLELRAGAAALGVARVEHLGYADSGHGRDLYPDPPGRVRFVRAEVDEAADRLAAVLREERADVLLSYDRHGGYGHRDHVRVHEIGSRAATLAGVPRVLDATMPRESLGWAVAVARLSGHSGAELRTGFTARADLTHRIDVGRYTDQRIAALRAHSSMLGGDSRFAAIGRFLIGIPKPLRAKLFRWEWYAEEGAPPAAAGPLDTIFASPLK